MDLCEPVGPSSRGAFGFNGGRVGATASGEPGAAEHGQSVLHRYIGAGTEGEGRGRQQPDFLYGSKRSRAKRLVRPVNRLYMPRANRRDVRHPAYRLQAEQADF
ncbi:hypothetical protein D1872_273820 [compost metagenome]